MNPAQQVRTFIIASTAICGSLFAMNNAAVAQLAPEIGYVQPAGAQAGTSVEVTIGGYDWTPDMQLFLHDTRVKLERLGPPSPVLITEAPYWFGAKARGYAWPLPREFKAVLTVPADVPPGLIRWQAANANGVSPVGVLQIGVVPEVIEDVRHAEPQVLAQLPVTVSGQIRRIEEVDRYVIRPQQAGPITIQLAARQLTSVTNPMALHGIVQVEDDTGRRVVDASASEGNDLTVTFTAAANRPYLISLHDLDFAGDRSYVYRLSILPGPDLVAAYPSAGKRGEARTVEFVGWGVATGAAQLESITCEISFPADLAQETFATTLETPFGKSTSYQFLLSDTPELIEGTSIAALPGAITGILETRFGSDVYSLELRQGDVWQIAARTRKAGPPLDLDLTVLGPDGKELATVDDVPGSTDPELSFTVPTDGLYRFVVADRSGHSGDRSACYRLSIDKPREDFALTLPDLLSVPVGTTVKLPVAVVRRGGFKGPVNLAIEGLPGGITIPTPLNIAEDKPNLEIEVACAADAATLASLATLSATATINGAPVTRSIKKFVVAAIMKPKIKITPEGLDDVSKVRRGSTHLFPLFIDRLDGFAGEITLEMTAKQQRHRQGLTSDEMIVPADAKRFDYPIFVPEWMETTKTSRMIMNGAIQVPDPKGNVRTLLQRMELRVGILPEGALMKLTHAKNEFQTTCGGKLTVPLTVSRVPEFRETIRIELAPTEAQVGLISAEPIILTPGQSQTELTVSLKDDAKLIGEQPIQIRATALQDGKWLVKSETELFVDVSAK